MIVALAMACDQVRVFSNWFSTPVNNLLFQGAPKGQGQRRQYQLARQLADVFDALTTARPYKKAWSVEDAVAQLHKDKGRHFDPHLVELFVTALPEMLVIKERWKE